MTTKEMKTKPFISAHLISDNSTSTISTARLVQFPADPTTEQAMLLVESSGTLDFWSSEAENGYSHNDGVPYEVR